MASQDSRTEIENTMTKKMSAHQKTRMVQLQFGSKDKSPIQLSRYQHAPEMEQVSEWTGDG